MERRSLEKGFFFFEGLFGGVNFYSLKKIAKKRIQVIKLETWKVD